MSRETENGDEEQAPVTTKEDLVREEEKHRRMIEKAGTASTLRIVVEEFDEARERIIEQAKRAEETGEGTDVKHVGFSTPEQLREMLTPRRIELIESLMGEPAESITALARRLDRNYPEVHDDVMLLKESDIVRVEKDGGRSKVTVPYERVEYEGVITAGS